MTYLKEDGSLDVERINNLPLDERLHKIGKFIMEQVEEYFPKAPIKESHVPITLLDFTANRYIAPFFFILFCTSFNFSIFIKNKRPSTI